MNGEDTPDMIAQVQSGNIHAVDSIAGSLSESEKATFIKMLKEARQN